MIYDTEEEKALWKGFLDREKVFEVIKQDQNFILEGGAGSGKTYSLISIIEKISIEEPQKTIVCITYTNNAVAEIKSRIVNDKLQVATIHDFIWKLIKKICVLL